MAQKEKADIVYGVMTYAERRFVMYCNNNMGKRYNTMGNTGNYIQNGNHYTSGNTNTQKSNNTEKYIHWNGCMPYCSGCQHCPCCGHCCIVVVVNTGEAATEQTETIQPQEQMTPQKQNSYPDGPTASEDCELW